MAAVRMVAVCTIFCDCRSAVKKVGLANVAAKRISAGKVS